MLASQSITFSIPLGHPAKPKALGSLGHLVYQGFRGGISLVLIVQGHVGSCRRAVGLQRSAVPPWAPHRAPGAGAAVLGKPRTAPWQGLRVKQGHRGFGAACRHLCSFMGHKERWLAWLPLAPGHARAVAVAPRAAVGRCGSDTHSLPVLTRSHPCRANPKPSRKP